MRLSVAVQAMIAAWETGRVPLVVGEPGLGKSEVAHQAASKVNRQVHRLVNLVQVDPIDVKGALMPDTKTMVTKTVPLEWVKRLNEQEPGVVFLDELGQALPSVMCAIAPFVLPDPQGRRRFGETYMDVPHFIVAATNRREDRSCVNQLPDFFASRLTELPVEFHFGDWEDWAVRNCIHPFVLAFGRINNDKIHSFVAGKRCPLARSWTFVSEFEKHSCSEDVKRVLVEGTLGKEATLLYWELRNCVNKLPRLDDILAGKNAKIPGEKALQYLVVCILGNKTSGRTAGNILKYLEGFPGEFQNLYVQDILARDKTLLDVRAIQEFVASHGGLEV